MLERAAYINCNGSLPLEGLLLVLTRAPRETVQGLLHAFIPGLIASGWFQGTVQSTTQDSVQRALLLNRNQVTQVVLPKLHGVFL